MVEIVQTTTPQEQEEIVKERKPRKHFSGLAVRFVLANERINIFRELLNIASASFNNDALPLIISEEGLSVRIMDPERVKMLDYFIHKSAFEEWHVHNHKGYPMVQPPAIVVLPISDILYTIEKAGKDARAECELQLVFATVAKTENITKTKPEKCPKCGLPTTNNLLPEKKRGKKNNHYKCKCGWRGKVRTWTKKAKTHETTIEEPLSHLLVTLTERDIEHWEIKPLEETPDDLPAPLLQKDCQIKMVTKTLKEKLERLSKRMDAIRITGTSDKLTFKGTNDEGIKGDVEFEKGTDPLLDIICNKETKAIFGIDQLLAVLPTKNISEVIGLEFSKDMPIILTLFTNMGTDTHIRFFIAPRIETNY